MNSILRNLSDDSEMESESEINTSLDTIPEIHSYSNDVTYDDSEMESEDDSVRESEGDNFDDVVNISNLMQEMDPVYAYQFQNMLAYLSLCKHVLLQMLNDL